jgi:hypothetical protein
MTYRGIVTNGVIVLEGGHNLREGMRVLVEAAPKKAKRPANSKKKPAAREGIRKFCGIVTNLPSDASEKVEEFLYGSGQK